MPITDELKERIILETIRNGGSGKTAAKLSGTSPSTVAKILKRHGLSLSIGRPPSCEVNHEAFDVLAPDVEYWAGFFTADGTVGDYGGGSPRVILELAEKDRGHVEKFRAFLKSTHAITSSVHKTALPDQERSRERNSVSFSVRSKRLAAALGELGVVKHGPDRAPTHRVENSVHYYRGAIDGDGTVFINEDKRRGYKYPCLILCGHMPLLLKYQEFLNRQNVDGNIIDTASGIFQIRISGAPAFKIIDLLYNHPNLVALDRKLVVAQDILANHRG